MQHDLPGGCSDLIITKPHNNVHIKEEVLRISIRLFSFDTTWTAQKTTPPKILLRRWKPLPSNDKGMHRPTDSPLIRHGPHRKWCVQQFLYCFLNSLSWNVFTEQLPSNEKGSEKTDRLMGGIYEVAIEVGWVDNDIYIYIYIYIYQVSQGLIQAVRSWHMQKDRYTVTQTARRFHKPTSISKKRKTGWKLGRTDTMPTWVVGGRYMHV
jgi:hypothetical protein